MRFWALTPQYMSATAWLSDVPSLAAARERYGAQLPRLVAVLLAALIAVQLGFTVTRQRGGGAQLDTDALARSLPRPSKSVEVDLLAIVNAHLFGQKAVTSLSPGDAPPSNIPLVLAGVYAVADPQKGMAILGQTATNARLVKVGGQLAGSARLHSVYADRVLIDRGGSLEAIYLPKSLSSTPPPLPPVQSGGQRLQALVQNNSLLNGLLRVQAVTAQGKLMGFRVFPGGSNSAPVFSQLGLRAGDLITHVNGTALDDMNRSNEVLQTLSNASTASVTVSRNGEPVELNLNFTAVADAAEQAVAADAAAQSQGGGPGGPPNPRSFGNPGAFGPGGPPGGPGGRAGGRFRGNNTTSGTGG